MKIIKEGKLPVKIYTGTCNRCGCQIECDESETVQPQPQASYIMAWCPTKDCNTYINLDWEYLK